MNYKHNSTLLLCLAFVLTASCSDKKNNTEKQEQGVTTVLPDTKNEVIVQVLKGRNFDHEWVSNGQVNSCSKMLYNIGAYQSAKEGYEKLYSELTNRGSFLFEYGHFLYKLKEYEYEKAEECLIRSTHRLLGRIYNKSSNR